MTIAEQVAHSLLEIKAVALRPNEPFTWASGLKSPIYCDNRLTISYPQVRQLICKGLVEVIKTNYPDAEVIAGTATAGIPHAAWVAEALNLPLIYVRSKPKDHGQGKQIEGVLKAGQKVVVIDDLISTGKSVLGAVQAVQKDNAKVVGVAGIFSYQLAAADVNFKQAQIPLQTVTNYSTLIKVAKAENKISDAELAILKDWHL
ncbi:orotate phosphoribosyltransferase [Pediococcus ethanolidurans]|uniref:orotate phosphoribosyltransferase n=1 Tax=Pediococcus ethanolidurans TaxID=319653 RepID=UPI001C1EA664|nr:orotate phosphoribosyltransferase [Pediococcus ethanolidurans]MBU7554223.1 orotate phosphoribosyltransferase [Pediococcus ethanolidurans]MBU7563964.1 orotate phosphoribosyltransferase [Pediococcus ethanolidurans]MCT4398969.1 orotate phosphoribosyltransferase [Pediococcus ethanolidurans]MCV3321296.1 orotate phosphoribosyltransferase [Pediococcus ethanolidurans]MCV3323688.1 orotate phosphoribosyltransferase [Pediococcus ethanolidurans]